MHLLLDDIACTTTAGCVGAALDEAAAMARARDRLVVEVVVDGKTWSEGQIDSDELRALPADEVRLVTVDARSLVRETLDQAGAALTGADEQQRAAAAALQEGRGREAMDHLASAIATWSSTQVAVSKSAEALGLDLDALRFEDGATLWSRIRELERQLRSVRDALEADDTVALADTLMYELPSVVSDWKEVLDSIRGLAMPDAVLPSGPGKRC